MLSHGATDGPASDVARRRHRPDLPRVCAALTVTILVLIIGLASAPPATAATAHANADDPAHLNPDCQACHQLHIAPTERSLLSGVSESAVCYTCHGTTPTSPEWWNIYSGTANSFFVTATGPTSGHSLEDVTDPAGSVDLTNSCTGCHGVHGDPDFRANLPANEQVVGVTIDPANPRSWCLSCHNSTHSWWTSVPEVPARTAADYNALIQDPTRDASGYPDEGTFPGADFYATSTSLHANIPAWEIESMVTDPAEPVTRVAGDCLWCHASHRSDTAYDGLLAGYGPSVPADTTTGGYAQLCFECHGNSSEGKTSEVYASTGATKLDDAYWAAADAGGDAEGAPDIYSLVTAGGGSSGHRILTENACYEVGSPLPCYECHNPHGSKNGNLTMFSDALGADLDTSTAEGVRRFCFTCHTSYDTDLVTGRPYGWDSIAAAYVPVAADAEIVGLPRDASAATEENRLRLWQVSTGHDHDDTQDCLAACHGDVHAPMGSPVGATNCFDSSCHSALHGMVDDTTSYHHVLNSASPDQPPAEGVYPTFSATTQELSCVSCHMDHTAWKDLGNSYNLRSDALVSDPTASNTDEGLCLSCHSYTLPFRIYRSAEGGAGIVPTPSGQADNALPATAVMRVEDDYWVDSPHNYPAKTYFTDESEFVGNCAKCHGTLEPGQYTATTPYSFTVHYSPEQRLLNALGQDRSSLPAPQTAAINEEDMRFRCHSNSPDKLGASTYDYYGTQPMSTANRAIGAQIDGNPFGHKPGAYYMKHPISSIDETQAYLGTVTAGVPVNKHVECADCHNHHIVGKARHVYGTDNRVSDAIKGVRGVGFKSGELANLALVNWPTSDPISYGSGVNDELEYKQMATYEYEICFKCHSSANADSGGNVALGAWGGTMEWTVWPAGTTGTNAAVDNWTNVALDFNVGNNSRHPVFATLSGYYYPTADAATMSLINNYTDIVARGTSSLEDGQVSNGWSPNDTMMCSDCHGDSNAPIAMIESPPGSGSWITNPLAEDVPQGPHGASVRFSLRGPATDWPVRTDLATPRLITLADMADASYTRLFCNNCHPKARLTTNRAHSAGGNNHGNIACVGCHVLIPHGSKVSRLIGDRDTMPLRYAYQGNRNTMMVNSFIKTSGTYGRDNCSVPLNSSCDTHSKGHNTIGNQTGGSWENW